MYFDRLSWVGAEMTRQTAVGSREESKTRTATLYVDTTVYFISFHDTRSLYALFGRGIVQDRSGRLSKPLNQQKEGWRISEKSRENMTVKQEKHPPLQ
jgi:hypothetical protein